MTRICSEDYIASNMTTVLFAHDTILTEPTYLDANVI